MTFDELLRQTVQENENPRKHLQCFFVGILRIEGRKGVSMLFISETCN